MPERSEITYFGAGPAGLPTDVLQGAAQALLNFQGNGLGIAEISHRSAIATKIINDAQDDLRKFLDIPDEYAVLFMQAGGTGEFSATVYNLVGAWITRKRAEVVEQVGDDEDKILEALRKKVDEELVLDYIITGNWSLKAYQEACRLLGSKHVNVAVDARNANNGKFGVIPDESTWKLSKDAAMVYYCDNETVNGVEFPKFPDVLAPKPDGTGSIVVTDMSSNILSRHFPVRNFSAFFFGAQKNLGITGVTVTVIKRGMVPPECPQPDPELMRKLGLPIPPIVLSYGAILKENSLYNTLSIFDVYVAGQVLQKLRATYPNGVKGQEDVSNKKAALIYAALERRPDLFRIVPDKTVRSRMNICFRVNKGNEEGAGEKFFLDAAKREGLEGLKGHRSVGGIRASNYNSITLDGATKLAEFIGKFTQD